MGTVKRSVKIGKITHGDLAGFWCVYRPGRSVESGPGQYGGRPLVMFKFGSRHEPQDN